MNAANKPDAQAGSIPNGKGIRTAYHRSVFPLLILPDENHFYMIYNTFPAY